MSEEQEEQVETPRAKFDIEYANSPVRVSDSQINLTVKFHGIPEELPFTASPYDTEEHGRILYQNAILGEYGTVG